MHIMYQLTSSMFMKLITVIVLFCFNIPKLNFVIQFIQISLMIT